MVDAFLFTFSQPTLKRQPGGGQDCTKRGTTMMANTMQQHKHTNNKAIRGVGKSCLLLEVMVMIDSLPPLLLQHAQNNA
jgi:hypothetical protein